MNGLREHLLELKAIGDAASSGRFESCDALICPPTTILASSRALLPSAVAVGGQDCHAEPGGAFTGDISAAMLADAGATHVIVGHSERRTAHIEDDALVRRKCEAAWTVGLIPLVCIGETDAERDSDLTLNVLGRQLAGSLPDGASPENVVVAYEPVWAIGTGRMPTADDVAEVHAFLRRTLAARFGAPFGDDIRILYGGSVKPSNARELLALSDVDGALVGGASLKAADFISICEHARRM